MLPAFYPTARDVNSSQKVPRVSPLGLNPLTLFGPASLERLARKVRGLLSAPKPLALSDVRHTGNSGLSRTKPIYLPKADSTHPDTIEECPSGLLLITF